MLKKSNVIANFVFISLINLIFLLLGETSAYANSETLAPPIFNQKNFLNFFKKHDLNALSIGIITPRASYYYHIGFIEENSSFLSVNENTKFPINVMQPILNGILLQSVVNANKLSLNDPLKKYLPLDFKINNFANINIKLSDLATQTAGLPELKFAGVSNQNLLNQQTIYSLLNGYSVLYAPGEYYQHSNVSLALIANILQRVSQKSYSQLLKEIITQPLGMANTEIDTEQNIYSSTADLTKLLSAYLGFDNANLFEPMANTLTNPLTVTSLNNAPLLPDAEPIKVVLGWFYADKYQYFWQAGNDQQVNCFIGFNPATQLGIVVLAKAGNMQDIKKLGENILINAPRQF